MKGLKLLALGLLFVVGGSAFGPAVPTESPVAETRCGWFVNPTPANAWLTDAAGEWIIGTQGGYQAEGDWPVFKPSQWRKTNGNDGYSYSCLRVTINRREQQIVTILFASSRSLATCRKDKALKGKEPMETVQSDPYDYLDPVSSTSPLT